jgi:hypothetical protein
VLNVNPQAASVNRRNESEDGSSPLHGACYGGHGDVVRYLLQRGADASRKNNYKERPRNNAENPAAGVTPAAAQECRGLIELYSIVVLRYAETVLAAAGFGEVAEADHVAAARHGVRIGPSSEGGSC